MSGGRHSQCEEQIVCGSCIHSWGLHPPPLVLLRKRLRLHAEMFPCHFHPTLSVARCLPKCSTTPVLYFQREPSRDCTRGFVTGWGWTGRQMEEGEVTQKGSGIRSCVPGAFLSHISHSLMETLSLQSRRSVTFYSQGFYHKSALAGLGQSVVLLPG